MKWSNDAHLWAKKWSTWLALFGSCAGTGLATYAGLPPQAQATVPTWALTVLSGVAIFCTLLVPLATSLSQAAIENGRKGG